MRRAEADRTSDTDTLGEHGAADNSQTAAQGLMPWVKGLSGRGVGLGKGCQVLDQDENMHIPNREDKANHTCCLIREATV